MPISCPQCDLADRCVNHVGKGLHGMCMRSELAACAQVFQVRKRDSGVVYAMKVMRKERILAKDHGDYVKAERDALTAVFHPYIVTLRCSFQARSLLPSFIACMAEQPLQRHWIGCMLM